MNVIQDGCWFPPYNYCFADALVEINEQYTREDSRTIHRQLSRRSTDVSNVIYMIPMHVSKNSKEKNISRD